MHVIPYVSTQPLRPAIHDLANNLGLGKIVFKPSTNGKGIHFGVETHTEVWTYSPNQLLVQTNVASLLRSTLTLYLKPETRASLSVDYIVTSDLSALTGGTWVVDIETGGSIDGDPSDRYLLSVALWDGNKDNPVHVIPGEELPDDLGTLLGTKNLVAHNAQFDMKDINYQLGTKLRARHDTMIMHYALHTGASKHGLKDLCRLFLGVDDWDRDVKKFTSSKKDYSHIPRELLYEYNAKDVYYTAKLWQHLNAQLTSSARRFYENRMLKSHFLQGIEEERGMYLDVPYFEKLDRDMQAEITAMRAQIPINPNSPKQVKEFFGTKDSTAETLAGLENPVATQILELRKISKIHSTYVQGLLKRQKDSYVHPSFKVTATVTGRLASANPNAQNIPRKSAVKAGLKAPPGYRVVTADYSQIEARVMAVLSGDKNMQAVFQRDSPDFFDLLIPAFFPEDFPTYEHYRIFKYDVHKGNESHYRTIAKGVVYGLSFGRGAAAIGAATGLSEEQAQEIINNYAKAYPQLWAWRKVITAQGANGTLETLTGMRFEQEVSWPNPSWRQAVERSALSFMPQHHANECLLDGMILFSEKLNPTHGWIHGLVHDAGYVYVLEEHSEHYAQLLSECLEQSATNLLGDAVVFAAEPEILDSWEET